MEKKRKYITGIDGLRSIAVIGVILYHLTPWLMPGGFLGVTLFFVISGYLMTDILLTEWESRQKIALTHFYMKRARRIYPSLIAVFVLSGSAFLFLAKDLLTNFREIVLSSLLNFNNFWQIFNGSSYFDRFGNESAFTHLWSLSIEGQFYIIWPIVIAFLLYKQDTHQRLTRLLIFGTSLSAILMIAFYNPDTLNRLYYGTDTRIFSILMGAYLAVFIRDYDDKIQKISRSYKLIALVSSSLFIIISFIFFKDSDAFVYQGGMLLFSFASMVLLGCVLTDEKSNWLLTNQIFKWIGTRSYEIYLWQFPVMIAYAKIVKWNGSNSFWHLFVQFMLIFLLSEFTYRLVFFFRRHVTFSKEWLMTTLESVQGKAILISSIFVFGLFLVSFYVAPSGRSAASVSLEKKLNENKKLISETTTTKEKTKESRSTEESSTTESSTIDSSTKERKEPEVPAKELLSLSNEEKTYLQTLNITAIGDSLLLSAAPEIKSIFPQAMIDAEVGRQFVDSEPIFGKMAKEDKLGDVVLVVLGTNGSFSSKDVAELMSYNEGKEVFFVNTMVQRPWQKNVNDELKKTKETYENAHVIDWKEYSSEMYDWFDVDNVHLTPIGAENFSILVGEEIYKNLNK